jgi:hypothetical protein
MNIGAFRRRRKYQCAEFHLVCKLFLSGGAFVQITSFWALFFMFFERFFVDFHSIRSSFF